MLRLKTIGIKITFAMVSVILITGGASIIVIQKYLKETYAFALKERGGAAVTHLAVVSLESVLVENKRYLKELLDKRRKTVKDFSYAFITDVDNNILADTFPHGFPLHLLWINKIVLDQEISVKLLETEEEELIYDFAVPIMLANDMVGTARMGISLNSMKIAARKIIIISSVIILAILVVGMLIAVGVTRLIVKPIRSLQHSADEITKSGNLENRIMVKTGDETEQLANSFNEMITSLKNKTDELKKSHEELEERVAERTSELKEANIKLQELDRLKSMFIASMSHELRTPLNSIIGFSSIILGEWIGPVNDEQKENLKRVCKSGKHLLALINDVIDVSKIEAGKIDVYLEDFDLYEVVSESLALFTEDIKKKKLDLRTNLIHQTIHTDRRRLLQCLVNLIGNAMKYTEKGIITVEARLLEYTEMLTILSQRIQPEAPWVEISITDTGIGIKEEDLPKLFLAFQRIDSPLRSSVAGTGLGLYLVKKILDEIINGIITVDSKPGTGSTFSIYIPLKP
jgi:signal transduction histidine kinase